MIQCDKLAVPETTTFSWRLGAKSAPEIPRYVIVGFQTGKSGNQRQNAALFDHCNLKNIYVMLNSQRYPEADYNIDFIQNKFMRVYDDAAEFKTKFYNLDELFTNPNISPLDYKNMFPLFVFDVSKQSERLKMSTTDIKIQAQFSENVPANTIAYAVVLSDRIINFESNGQTMSVVI